jgi:P-type conjugative transfer protein TrbJ
MGGGLLLQSRPAYAIPVFDSANYAQNLLTAARMLQQINQQIQSLQNEASMLTNMAKNLSRISFPELSELTNKLRAVDRLMAAAQGIDFRIDALDSQFKRLAAGLSGVATAARHAVRNKATSALGIADAAERGREAAWSALGTGGAKPAGARQSDVPDWARAMQRCQDGRHHRHLAAQTLKEGDRGGASVTPDIREKDD